MTGRQAHYLAGLAARAGEEAETTLTRLEATERITALQQRIGRAPPPWARSLTDELAAHRAASRRPEETAQSAAARLFEAREGLGGATKGPDSVATRLRDARSRLRDRTEVRDALDVSAAEAIEALAAEGRLAAEDALAPEAPSFEPEPIDFSPEAREAEAEREVEAGRELSRQRSRERGSPGRGPGVGGIGL